MFAPPQRASYTNAACLNSPGQGPQAPRREAHDVPRNPWAVVRVCVVNLATIFAVTDCSATTREWMGVLGVGEFTNPGSWFDGVPTNNTTSDVAVFFGFFSGPVFSTVNLSVERSVRGLVFLAPQGFGSPVNFAFSG